MKAKYVIVESAGLELPIVFNPILSHDFVLGSFLSRSILAAGFCELIDGKWSCYGESESLKRCSGPRDAEILNKNLQIDI